MLTTGNTNSFVQLLLECAMACENSAQACIGGMGIYTECDDDLHSCTLLLMFRDCSEICIEAARFIKRGSPFGREFAMLAGRAARLCELECAKYVHIESLSDCAEICSRTSYECECMATQEGIAGPVLKKPI